MNNKTNPKIINNKKKLKLKIKILMMMILFSLKMTKRMEQKVGNMKKIIQILMKITDHQIII